MINPLETFLPIQKNVIKSSKKIARSPLERWEEWIDQQNCIVGCSYRVIGKYDPEKILENINPEYIGDDTQADYLYNPKTEQIIWLDIPENTEDKTTQETVSIAVAIPRID